MNAIKFREAVERGSMEDEDRNVLIKAEQNKKKYWLPEDCWGIVKEHLLLPPALIKVVNARALRPYYSNIGWAYGTGSEYPDLYRYLRDAKKKGKIDETQPNYYEDFLLVARSKAKKAKEDLVRYLKDNEHRANERSRKIKMDLLYDEEFANWRKNRISVGNKYGWEEIWTPRETKCESDYKLYLEFMTEVRQYICI